jgi:hypothetical protein
VKTNVAQIESLKLRFGNCSVWFMVHRRDPRMRHSADVWKRKAIEYGNGLVSLGCEQFVMDEWNQLFGKKFPET